MRQSTEAYGNLSFPLGCSRSSHLEKWCIILLIPVSGSLLGVWVVVGVWVLLVEYGTLDFSGDDFVRCAMLGLTVDTGLATVLGFWKNFTYFLRRRGLGFWRFFSCKMEKFAQSMLRFEPLHALFALGVQTLFLRAHELDPV